MNETDTVLAENDIRELGTDNKGNKVLQYTLRNSNDLSVSIMNYGGIITAIHTPDRYGINRNIVLGFDHLEDYLNDGAFLGATIGRYANRISNAAFSLHGKNYTLAPNDAPNNLHSGPNGFNHVTWDAELLDPQRLKLSYTSPDGENGFPGNLQVSIMYTLTDNNELVIDYEAVSDQDTPVSFTNHSYFNLTGRRHKRIYDHTLQLDAREITVADDRGIPTGEFKDIINTAFDFTIPTRIGDRINNSGQGFDHNYVLQKTAPFTYKKIATVWEPDSGRKMETFSDMPGVQFYTGNHLEATDHEFLSGNLIKHSGFCLETQMFPDSPNRPEFPSCIIRADNVYNTKTTYKFSTE